MHPHTSIASATAVSCDDALREPLALLEGRFAEGSVEVPGGRVSYRSCGSGPVVVLLHGISSGAASWLQCALKLESQARVIAWNAPGYGRSTPLTMSQPKAVDYAKRLQDMLQALEVEQCVLVGHSLGALMAAAYLAHGDGRARRTLLADPALGYGAASKQERAHQVREERLGALRTLGIAGMAQKPTRLLSAHASVQDHAWVRWNMQWLDASGYTQAVQLLCGDDIAPYLQAAPRRGLSVACGAEDIVTTPEASEGLARQFELPFKLVDAAGHACYIEQPSQFAALVSAQLTSTN
ncbi:alpha/beta superfamily hydrolase/acyltransferase [Herbaspirillum frisingense GSF30]|uniref:Alpha/beta superfamily hydrolase/acyltransferase n=1 Tax=Herbaspirillum frisingense GSF30 TaxID=864073 RepID=A0AAI9N4U9_9BURK|nr:alpha/beta hydrolase [Herbaspirillum frisingense]EOA05602.1 alpha/beta superfamily hydrolase/acyltransferase [Herbaspirillum frisingense GSF30]